jgi:hypothetical protein
VAAQRRRGRVERRAQARAHEKLVRDLDRLARLEPGGTPDQPVVIESPSVVELRAVAKPCPLCGGSRRLETHAAEKIAGVRLRVAWVRCTLCGTRRAVYFRLAEPTVH